jgi:hypothetical protein
VLLGGQLGYRIHGLDGDGPYSVRRAAAGRLSWAVLRAASAEVAETPIRT